MDTEQRYEIDGWELELWNGVLMKLLVIGTLIGMSLLVQPVFADVVSKECPFSCDSESLDPNECRDWKEGDTCFVEHPSLSKDTVALNQGDDDLRREIRLIEKSIEAGEREEIRLRDEPVERVDVVIRREGEDRQTQLAINLDPESGEFGGPQQVDQNTDHVLRFQSKDGKVRGKNLVLNAIDGEVFVESVHVFYGEADA